jgi:hypothetical protein
MKGQLVQSIKSTQIESGQEWTGRESKVKDKKRSGFAPLTLGVPTGGALALALALCQDAPGVAASEIRRSFVVSVVGS